MGILKAKNILLLIIIFTLFITVRVVGLGSDILNTDAERWHRRSNNFLEALKQRKYIETYQRYHPGVTLMWFNSIVKYVDYKYQLTQTDTPLTLEHADYFVYIHGISKAFNIIVLATLLGFQLYFLYKLFNLNTSLLYGFLISVEPYMIGIDRWFHQTSFEVFFGFTALLALLVWYKNSKTKYLVISALLLTFSILAKITSLILGPILLLIFISKLRNTYKLNYKPVFIYGLLIIGFVFIFFPALWIDPLFVFNKIYGHVFSAVTDNIRADMLSGLLLPLYYPIILILKLSPITLLLFPISLFNLGKTKDFNIKILILSIINYFLFLTFTDQKIDRYSLIFFPFIISLIAIYVSQISLKPKIIVLSLSSLFLLFTIYTYHPVYSAYYSPLVGGTKSALKLGVYDNSGEYFAQAAQYLNTKPRETNIYVPDGYSSINLYLKPNIQREYTQDINYVVRSYDMQRLDMTDPSCTKLDKIFGSKEHPIVYVWECD